ncbi:ATP-binding cassette domain-containing protein [Acidobacterium sp. S8]|uniref:ATP-binding cassette domain-containing protein n=1 Tax=Acidobacterium sp. S8 TaxID=1641854 RepID=UPI00131CAB05|nr:ATP-binding cassette domain-containing protein [Acidobacterium sp. S8]
MPDVAFLTTEIEHRVGAFDLRVDFRLTAPWTVLFGPSGAGKSTVLRAIAGLLQPKTGKISLRNHTLVDTRQGVFVDAGKRRVGFLTQQPTLFPHLTVRRNISFGLHALARMEREKRINEMLRLFRIEELAERLPAKLSGGEYQRAALARALAPDPELLLLDEPFSGLDAALKEAILRELTVWLTAHGVPALYVSHDLVEAYQTAADVIVIENGRVVVQGPVQEVLATHREQLLRQLGVITPPKLAPAPTESQIFRQP